MKFTLNVNMAVQFIGIAIQGLTMATNLLPEGNDKKELIVLSVAVLQSISAMIAHFKNPDGAPASPPYKK